MINKLIYSGAKIVKGEILHDPNIALNINSNEKYLGKRNKIIKEKIRDVIERKVVSLYNYEKIFSICKKKKIPFVLSVYDFKGANFAKEIGAGALKIASSNLMHRPLIEHVCKLKLPIILDTGRSSYTEIKKSLSWFKIKKFNKIHIQHSPYPPPHSLNKHDLLMLKSLKRDFNLTVGLSDHHSGNEMLYAAIALGANSVEKGIISNLNKDDQDVHHALSIKEFEEVNKKCINVYKALGKSRRFLSARTPRHNFRMCIISSRNIKKNEKLSEANLTYAFPVKGIEAEFLKKILGKRLKKQVNKFTPIKWENLNGN
tara:strand:- start:67 stop:1011 length:945 start_codon:yes stop_codon:yes gene_type:complete